MQQQLQELATEGMAWVLIGQVTAVDEHADFGYLLTLELVDDGRTIQARPMWGLGGKAGEGIYSRIEVDDEALVLLPGGDPNRAVAIVGPSSSEAKPPTGWANDKAEIVDRGGLEVRTAQAALVEPLVKAQSFETGLNSALAELQALLAGIGLVSPITTTFLTQLNAGAYRTKALKSE